MTSPIFRRANQDTKTEVGRRQPPRAPVKVGPSLAWLAQQAFANLSFFYEGRVQ